MQDVLERIQKEVTPLFGKGRLASYIPELEKVDPSQFSMTVNTLDGKIYSVGCSEEKFSIQSISKVLVLAMAMGILDDRMWLRVGREPSGTSFNSLVQLENEMGKPRNPFLNSGAIVSTDVILEHIKEPYDEILNFIRQISKNNTINYDKKIAASEIENSERNMALAFFMKSFKNIKSDPKELIDLYSHHCSVSMTTVDLAEAFSLLANKGVIPGTDKNIISSRMVKRINSLMLTSGMYDNVGDFAYRVGLPAKSGVGGGIVAVLPGKLSVCVWSPELNLSGNSLVGTRALELFTSYTGLSIF